MNHFWSLFVNGSLSRPPHKRGANNKGAESEKQEALRPFYDGALRNLAREVLEGQPGTVWESSVSGCTESLRTFDLTMFSPSSFWSKIYAQNFASVYTLFLALTWFAISVAFSVSVFVLRFCFCSLFLFNNHCFCFFSVCFSPYFCFFSLDIFILFFTSALFSISV